MDIRGLSKLTLLDYPEHIACTVFTGGCSFRCPFCHNGGLVLKPTDTPLIDEQYFFDFLESRKGKLEGVCITGGEPTLRPGLSEFMKKIKDKGYRIKLDTNGYQPAVLENLISEGLLDMIAMDIKNSPAKYAITSGITPSAFDLSRINESILLIKNSGLAHEFRTTVVREMHSKPDISEIAEWLQGDSPYYLQNYKDSEDIISKYDKSTIYTSFTEIEMVALLSIARKYLPNSHIRGIED